MQSIKNLNTRKNKYNALIVYANVWNLSADVIKKYYWLVSLERDRVMAQIDIDVLESIPIPKNISTAIQKKIVGLVNKINNSTDSTEDEVTLNLLIEDLYFSN